MIGNKIYVNELSAIGGLGIGQTIVGIDPLLKKYGIEDRFLKRKKYKL